MIEMDLLPEEAHFINYFNIISAEVHKTATSKGWWETDRNDDEMIALMHAELSEALECLRDGNPPDDKLPEFRGIEVELADLIIRVMDTAHKRGWHVAKALIAKNVYNQRRPYRHGGKSM